MPAPRSIGRSSFPQASRARTRSPYQHRPPLLYTTLQQVNSLLALDPGNEQYKSLASDLAAATRLTEQLIKAQSGEAGAGAGAGEAAEASAVPTGMCVGA